MYENTTNESATWHSLSVCFCDFLEHWRFLGFMAYCSKNEYQFYNFLSPTILTFMICAVVAVAVADKNVVDCQIKSRERKLHFGNDPLA